MGTLVIGMINASLTNFYNARKIHLKKPGFIIELVHLMCEALKFKCEIEIYNGNGSNDLGVWIELLEEIHSRRFNTSIPVFSIPMLYGKHDRYQLTDTSVFRLPMYFATKATKSLPILPIYDLFEPLSRFVWLILLISILIISALFAFSIHKSRPSHHNPLLRFFVAFLSIALFLVRKGQTFLPKPRPATQIVFITWGFAAVVLTATYSSGLMSALIEINAKPPFDDITSLAECVQAKTCRLTIINGTDDWFLSSINDETSNHHILRSTLITNPPLFVNSLEQMMWNIQKSQSQFLVSEPKLYKIFEAFAKQFPNTFTFVRDNSGNEDCSFPFRFGDPLRKLFNRQLLFLNQAGLVQGIANSYDIHDSHTFNSHETRVRPIRLSLALAAISLLSIGVGIGIITLILERIITKLE